MTNLKQPADRGGDARNRLDILKGNYGKWEGELSERQIRKIESISGDILSELGYPVTYHGEIKKIGALEMDFYKCMDALSLLRFEVRENGAREGLRNIVRTARYVQFRAVGEEEEQ